MLKRTLIATAVMAVTVGGCSSKASHSHTPPPPPPSPTGAPPNADVVPGSTTMKASVGLSKKVTYPDKITVAITAIKHAVDKDVGPGAISGKPITIFTLRFTNGSGKPLNLNAVQVTAEYGSGHAEASPVYTSNLNDFSGTVQPSAEKSSSYAFALPKSGLGDVTIRVRFDSTHATAVFAGSLR
jgi:hypothetical protein